MKTPDLQDMTLKELQDLTRLIDAERSRRQQQKWATATMTPARIKKVFDGFGFETSKRRAWRIKEYGDFYGCYGMEVGGYVHSCHIDTTDFIVLLVYNGQTSQIEEFDKLALEGPMLL